MHPQYAKQLLGPEWVEHWALERGKLEAQREWTVQSGASSPRALA
jgi:hypothetical protein